MKRENVGRGEQFLETDFLYALWQLMGGLAGHGLHFHAEGEGYLCHPLAYVAESYDAEGLACQLMDGRIPIAEVGVVAPSAVAVLLGIVLCAVGHRQQVRKHHLRHALRAVGRYVGHNDAVLVGSGYVYDVVARSQHSNILQARQLLHLAPSYDDLVGKHDLGVGSPCHRLFGRRAVVDGQVAHFLQRSPGHVARIGRIAVENYDFHTRSIQAMVSP